MHEAFRSRRVAAAAAVLGLAAAGVAVGLPWDIDMADSQANKAYSLPMKGVPQGAIAQPSLLSPVGFTQNHDRMSPEGQALTNPYPTTDTTKAQGERMFAVFCTPCHGDGEKLGTVGQPGRFPGVLQLSGPTGVAKLRTDGYLYLTIRNGGAVMPYYGWAMTDQEMWSVVQYVRTLPGAAYVPPAIEEASQ